MDDNLAMFMSVTGCESDTTARQWLEAGGGKVDAAIELYLQFGLAPVGDAPPAFTSTQRDEELARALQSGKSASRDDDDGGGGSAAAERMQDDEAEVREPLPQTVDRLYEPSRLARMQQQVNVTDPFRDFKAEADQAGNAQPSSKVQGLSDMFKPPLDVLFKGDFDLAKQTAQGDNRWLLVNVQDTRVFASHELNRDTWSNSSLQDIIKGSFIFWQTQYETFEGQRVAGFYRLVETQLPVILVIDPITGLAARKWEGKVQAEDLSSNLLPFLECGPSDSQAGQLAIQAPRPRRDEGAGKEVETMPLVDQSEDAQMAAAIMASLGANPNASQEGGPSTRGGDSAMQEGVKDASEEAARATKDAGAGSNTEAGTSSAQVGVATAAKAEMSDAVRVRWAVLAAQARLDARPREPSPSGTCVVAFRLPDGSRLKHTFAKDALVQQVYDLYTVLAGDQLQSDRFLLKQSAPGGGSLDDVSLTVQAAGIAGALLIMTYKLQS